MKTPKPRKLESGNYFIQLRLNGKSIPITCDNPTECTLIAQKIKADYMAGATAIKKLPKNMTLREVEKKYINEFKEELSPSTADRYLAYTKCRFKKYLDMPLEEISWQQMIDDETKVASPKSVYNGWGLVRPALKFVGYPVPQVKLPSVPVSEIAFLQPEEIRPFCESVKGRNYEIAALIELHGLRLSEMKALTWDDIDLKKKVIFVRGAYVKGEDGYVDKDTNKNKTSTRPVPIMIPQLVTALNAVSNKSGRVVSTSGSVLLRDVKRSCERAGITVVTNHGLRHSFASLCFFLNVPLAQIMQWGGWGDDTTLKRIYIHLAASAETEHQKRLTGFFL